MKKHTLLSALLVSIPLCGFALDTKPWMGNLWEFNFIGEYQYSHYPSVQGAAVNLPSPSNDHLLRFDLGLTPSEFWDAQAEIEFADTPRQNWGLRSAAFQGRVLWLDDTAGDLLSWTTGLSVRGVSRHSLQDVSSPYHSDVNVELNSAVGKEWSEDAFWTLHAWGFLGVGMANHGSPWLRALAVVDKNWNDTHRAGIFCEGYFGFGDKYHVNVDHFDGWGKFHHQSIDLGADYRYHFDVWGELGISYAYRVFARTFPENVNFVTVWYKLPFSFF